MYGKPADEQEEEEVTIPAQSQSKTQQMSGILDVSITSKSIDGVQTPSLENSMPSVPPLNTNLLPTSRTDASGGDQPTPLTAAALRMHTARSDVSAIDNQDSRGIATFDRKALTRSVSFHFLTLIKMQPI